MNNIAVYVLDVILIALGIGFVKFGGADYLKTLLKDKIVHILVYAIEQKVQESGMGAEKKATVISQLESIHIKVDGMVDAMIEAAVAEINLLTKKTISKISE